MGSQDSAEANYCDYDKQLSLWVGSDGCRATAEIWIWNWIDDEHKCQPDFNWLIAQYLSTKCSNCQGLMAKLSCSPMCDGDADMIIVGENVLLEDASLVTSTLGPIQCPRFIQNGAPSLPHCGNSGCSWAMLQNCTSTVTRKSHESSLVDSNNNFSG